MASNTSLPAELLSHVLSHLDERRDKQTILAIRAANRQCNRLTRPLVYCKITDKINQHRHLNKPEVGRLQSAAWDVVRRPELASLIKSIEFEGWDFIGRDKASPLPEGVQPPSPEEYSAALALAGFPDKVNQAVLQQLTPETPAGHLSFLLAVCANLQTLKAPAGYGSFGSLIHRFIPSISENTDKMTIPPAIESVSQSSLSSLRELSLGNFFHDSALKNIMLLLSLPALRHFHVFGLGDSHIWTDHTLPAEPKHFLNHNPISLKLDSCMLSGPGLSILLGACAHPRELTIRWRPGAWNDHLQNEPIGEAIRARGQRLEHLHLDSTDVFKHRYSARGRPPGSYGSFTTLWNLNTLAVARYAFSGGKPNADDITSILPPTLERLYVLGVGNENDENKGAEDHALELICEEAKERLPSLGEVTMIPWHHYFLEEWFGRVDHRCVDYSLAEAKGLYLDRLM